MRIKFELNFMLLKLLHGAIKVLDKTHELLGKIHFYKAARCVYIVILKLDSCFARQAEKCHLILDTI